MICSGVNVLRFAISAVAASTLAFATAAIGQEVNGHLPSSWPGAKLFTDGVIPRIRIDLTTEATANLRSKARDYVLATVHEGGITYSNVGVHLKGSVGSFRTLDDKPALTLDFSRFKSGQKFHGLRKIHLNNSVEDPSYVNEIIGSEMFQSAGVPAPRATRALVTLNGSPRGLYVLKEGFTEDFLSCHFKQISDQLYEPEDGHDVDQPMKRNSVFAPAGSQKALEALAAAALEPEPAQRWQRLNGALDTERFLTFMSVEVMLGHRDGYCMARNNFRVYHDLGTDKMVFLPHGMDQLFGTADLPWQPNLGGLVARAVMSSPEGKQCYTERFPGLFTKAFNVERMTNRVNQLVEELRPVLSKRDWAEVREAATVVQQRITERQASLEAQLNEPPAKVLEFATGAEQLRNWYVDRAAAKEKADKVTSPDGLSSLHIAAVGETAASWRTAALIPRGHYRFEGRVKIASVQPLPYGVHHGAGLRIRGTKQQGESLLGDSAWQLLATDFQVEQAMEEVEFICELRAHGGEAWFELSSLRVVRKEL